MKHALNIKRLNNQLEAGALNRSLLPLWKLSDLGPNLSASQQLFDVGPVFIFKSITKSEMLLLRVIYE